METTSGVQRWQYGHLSSPAAIINHGPAMAQFMGDLNRWGAEGWELVHVLPYGNGITGFLKRPVPPAP